MQNKLASFSEQDCGTNAEKPSVVMLGSITKKVMGTRFMLLVVETLRMPMTAQQARGLRQALHSRVRQQQQAPEGLLSFHGQRQGRQ